jgi:5-methylcytosine-specific restriction enzyme subunit McrC
MKNLTLTEYGQPVEASLTIEERDFIRCAAPSISVQPMAGVTDVYSLTGGSYVGALQYKDLDVLIKPKVGIPRLMFMISYALDPRRWQLTDFAFGTDDGVVEAVIPSFVMHLRRALRRGLLQGYRTEEDALTTVRGRVRFADQLHRRYGMMLPVEVRFDEFTEDIEENRILKAAVERLGRMRLRHDASRVALRSFGAAFTTVSSVQYSPSRLPEIIYSRLNDHYRPAVELAKVILSASSLELLRGDVQGSAFLIDMNVVFEEFVRVSLREKLRLGVPEFPAAAKGKSLYLDEGRAVRLEPDLSWWRGKNCCFIGDAKYKRTPPSAVLHPDIYQMLAYLVATGLRRGLLIYAAGEAPPTVHKISALSREIEVLTIDLDASPEKILSQMHVIADGIQDQAGSSVAA